MPIRSANCTVDLEAEIYTGLVRSGLACYFVEMLFVSCQRQLMAQVIHLDSRQKLRRTRRIRALFCVTPQVVVVSDGTVNQILRRDNGHVDLDSRAVVMELPFFL